MLSHGDSLIGDVCVMHAVNRASLAEKRRAGYYGWLLNPSNLWVTWRDWWMLRGGRYRRIVAISERVRTQLKKHYGVADERIVTIPNGINLARFDPANAAARSEVRRSFDIPHDVPLVLFVGSQFRLKGLEFAIRALAQMETRRVSAGCRRRRDGALQTTGRAVGSCRSRHLRRLSQRFAANLSSGRCVRASDSL